MIHEYFGVNLKIVWQTIEEDLPLLAVMTKRMIANEAQKQVSGEDSQNISPEEQ